MTDEEMTVLECEEYAFTFTREELKTMYSAAEKADRRRIVSYICVLLAISTVMFFLDMVGFGSFLLGFLLFYGVAVYRSLKRYKANREDALERMPNSVYKYRFFEDELESDITRGANRTVLRIPYAEMKPVSRAHILTDFAAFTYRDKTYFLRKDAAAEGTRLAKTVQMLTNGEIVKTEKMGQTSFWLALAACAVAFILLATADLFDDYVAAKTVLSLIALPVTVSCLVYGIKLKKRGGKAVYIIVGVATTLLALADLLMFI